MDNLVFGLEFLAGVIAAVFVSVLGAVLIRSFNQYTKSETYHKSEIDSKLERKQDKDA